MPDWHDLLRRRLGRLGLSPRDEADVLDELGAHFEQLYEAAVAAGASPQQALAQAAAQVPDWKQFRRDLQRGKEDLMTRFARVILIPSLITMIAANAFHFLLYEAGLRPRVFGTNQLYVFSLYVPWIAAFPLFGALGAWLSRRAGGSLRQRLLAALAPVWVMAGLLFAGFLLAPVIEREFAFGRAIYAMAGYALGWILIPGIFLLLGALPFLGSAPAPGRSAAAHG